MPDSSASVGQIQTIQIDDLYDDAGHWHVNVGEDKLHPKRMQGRWRTIKWWTSSVWLLFLFGPYLRWGDRQAVLFDLPAQKFHLFGLTVLPQDLWILALVLLFFAILLAVVTAMAGRVFCGFFCFQTVWSDIYLWIETCLEGSPRQRQKLDAARWSFNKLGIKAAKHGLWLLIALLTGISFVAWFIDAGNLWRGLFEWSLPVEATITIGMFIVGTYSLAGFMREQTCLWLCPYARIQGVMVDESTVLPAYDVARGEPRGRVQRQPDTGSFAQTQQGDCVDCDLCVAVCPTGVDIRQGQQQGCITCALCIDACDAVMDKIGRPRGLIRYESLNGLQGNSDPAWYRRSRVWVYLGILWLSLVGSGYGLSKLDALELKVIQNRQPLYVLQSDGSIQNRYLLKVLNKTDKSQRVILTVSGPESMRIRGAERPVEIAASGVTAHPVFITIPTQSLRHSATPVVLRISTVDRSLQAERLAVFIAPER